MESLKGLTSIITGSAQGLGKGIPLGLAQRGVDIVVCKELILCCAEEIKAIVTAEEHNILGGYGSDVAEILVSEKPVPMEFVGVERCVF